MMFVKSNYKLYLIWAISIIISIFFKVYGFLNTEVLSINNYLVFLLVFGPALIVTIILVFKKILKTERN